MAGGEIGTLWVRVRPLLTGVAGELKAGIRAALVPAQQEIARAATANVKSSQREIAANKDLTESYKLSSKTAVEGAKNQQAVVQATTTKVAAAARANVASVQEEVTANKGLAESYQAIAKNAAAGSEEQRAALQLAADAVQTNAALIGTTAAESVAAVQREVAANNALIESYHRVARAAAVGSEEQRAAAALVAQATARNAGLVGASAGETVAAVRREIAANEALIASFKAAAGQAARGSEEERVASRLAAEAISRNNALIGRSTERAAAETGKLKGSFLGIGKLLGVAFGASLVVGFAKHVIADPTPVQKYNEVIRAQFGESGRVLERFGVRAGIALGIPEHASLEASAKFGVLFHNIGIAQPLAARMTLGFEQLAGSLSSIRGADPSKVMQSVVLAAAGNTRGLKQLGVAVDGASEKIALMKAGLISATNGALTPAQKAEALYLLATAHLGQYQKEAAKHSGDLANVQRRLSAEWDHAKELLGTALLPLFVKIAKAIADWLQKMERSGRLQRDINAAVKTAVSVFGTLKPLLLNVVDAFKKVAAAVGSAKTAIILFLAVLAINKIRAIASAITTFLIKQGILAVGTAAVEAQATTSVAFAGIGLSAEALSATIKTALITTGIGAVVVAVAIAVTEIILHFDTVKRYTIALAKGIAATWGGLKTLLIGTAKVIGGAMATAFLLPLRLFLEAAAKVTGFLKLIPGVGKLHSGLEKGLSLLKGVTTGLATSGASEVAKGASVMANAFGKAFQDALTKATDPGNPRWDQAKRNMHDTGTKITQDAASAIANPTGRFARAPGLALADSIFDQSKADAIKRAKARLAQAISTGNEAIKAAAIRLNQAILTGDKEVRDAQKRLADYIISSYRSIQQLTVEGNKKVVQAAKDAATNLDKIGQKVSQLAGKFLGGAEAPTKALIAQFAALQQQLLTGTGGAAVFQRVKALAAQVRGEQTKGGPLAQEKQLVTNRIKTLTDELNKHLIGWKGFEKKLQSFLSSQGITYKAIYRKLGKGAADEFQAQVQGAVDQAKKISQEPLALRKKLTAGGQGPKIIDPQAVQAAVNAKVQTANQKRLTHIAGLTQRINDLNARNATRVANAEANLSRVTARAISREQAARDAQAQTLRREQLKTMQHIAADAKKQSAFDKRVAIAAEQTAKAATVQIGSTKGFPTSNRNQGKTADNARSGAHAGVK